MPATALDLATPHLQGNKTLSTNCSQLRGMDTTPGVKAQRLAEQALSLPIPTMSYRLTGSQRALAYWPHKGDTTNPKDRPAFS